jgi:hypothetical protein
MIFHLARVNLRVMARWITGGALWLCAGCSGELMDLGAEPAPLLVLEGKVSGAFAGLRHPRVGLLWAGVPVYVPFCQEKGANPYDPDRVVGRVAAAGCRDPFDVVPDQNGPSVPLDVETGQFKIVIDGLPEPDRLVGDLSSRVGYASFVVYEDLDQDGELDLHRGCGRGGSDRLPEMVLAATFSNLDEEQLRFVYLEGPLDAGSYYYPHPGCTTALPQPGFSLWRVGPLRGAADQCELLPLDSEVELTIESPGTYSALVCGQRDNESFERPPMMRPNLEDIMFECLEDGSIAIVERECACPGVRVASLQGCFDEVECTNPDWDLREEVPSWWPCEVPQGP